MTTIPMDPVDVEQLPPEDVDACSSCKGVGAVWPASNDPQDIRDCSTCSGTGVIPLLGGVA
jgi:DnaJ-class molecular chaperone